MVLLVVNRSVEGLEAFALNSNGTLQTEGLADFGLCLDVATMVKRGSRRSVAMSSNETSGEPGGALL